LNGGAPWAMLQSLLSRCVGVRSEPGIGFPARLRVLETAPEIVPRGLKELG